MKHVTAIRKYVEQGQRDEAHSALDSLLALGPKNIEALKLRAFLYNAEGRFNEEAKIWEQVIEIDNEDVDAIRFYLKQRHEDQEHFYFTELLENGARRFHAYPRALLNAAVFGLFGCVSFVILGRMLHEVPQPNQLWLLLGLFGLLVVSPFVAIFAVYFRAIRHITVSPVMIEVATKFRRFIYKWQDVEKVALHHSYNAGETSLELVITPRDPKASVISIDMTDATSSIRAKSYLLRELGNYPVGIQYQQSTGASESPAPASNRKFLRY